MFEIAFTISLILAVLKMLDVIACSWLVVVAPMLITVMPLIITVLIGVILAAIRAGRNRK